MCWVKPDGMVEFRAPDVMRSQTVDLTVDVEADASGPPTLAAANDTIPTRVTVSSPAGSTLVVSDREAGQVIDDPMVTCALTTAQARLAGQLRLARSLKTLRIASVTVNLATAQNDLWAAAYALWPGARVRVSGLPSDVLGWSYQDYELLGWRKRLQLATEGGEDVEGQFLELDLEPAWDQGVFDTSRWAAADGAMTAPAGTITGTSTGTLVVTTTSGPTLSTAAGDYPCDFNWNGERITVTSAPASAVSPQTLTVTARGVAPSVARTHGSGEPFNVWNAARWAM
jgi:hypothetical protein